MRNKYFTYIKIDDQENRIRTSGVSWSDFYWGIQPKPQNLLILDGNPLWDLDEKYDYLYHPALGFEYVSADQMEAISHAKVDHTGNFSCIDIAQLGDLDHITNDELSELLFFSHKVQPLRQISIGSLQNRWLYHSHDDDWSAWIYMRQIEDYRNVINYKIKKELQGRKRSIADLPADIVDKLWEMFMQGAVLDFENSNDSGVRIYIIGNHLDMDKIHGQLDKHRERHDGVWLEYDTRKKQWKFYL